MKKQTFLRIGTIALISLSIPLLSFATSTIGTSISTDGNLTVNNNATLGDAVSDTQTIRGNTQIYLPDNTATAFQIQEGSNAYLSLTTTDSSEAITFGSSASNATVSIASGPAKAITIRPGAATTTNANGATTGIFGGEANGSGNGGNFSGFGGRGGTTGTGGSVNLTSGAGGTTSGNSGSITITSGATTNGATGTVALQSGNASGTGNNDTGNVQITTGTPTVTGAPGQIILTTGSAVSGQNVAGGNISITTGNGAGNQIGGYLTLTAGNGGTTGSGGAIILKPGTPGGSTAIPTATGYVEIQGGAAGSHLKSSQTTAAALTATGTDFSATSCTGCTDMKGVISGQAQNSGGTFVVTFDKPYASSPVCTISAANSFAQSNINRVYVTTSSTALTINYSTVATGSADIWNYICIE